MAARKNAAPALVRESRRLAEEDGLDLDTLNAAGFARVLDDWVLSGRLTLPLDHPLRRGGLSFSGEMKPEEMLELSDQAYRQEKSLSETRQRMQGDTQQIVVAGRTYRASGEDDEGPRDVPPPQIYGEELDVPACRKIVVVPGILGSEIVECTPRAGRSDDWKKIWPPLAADPDSVGPLDHLVDPSSDDGLPGAPTRRCAILEPAYDGLLGRLRADGYTEQNGKLHPWGYDWTRSNLDNGKLLKDYINAIAGVTKAKPDGDCVVDVICHSMGGLVTRAAIKSGAVVRRTVYLASPHHGASKAYFALHPEAPAPLASNWWQRLLINKLWNSYASEVQPKNIDLGAFLASLARQFASVYELLPDEHYFRSNRHFVTLWYHLSAVNVVGLDATYYNTADVCFPAANGMRAKVKAAMRFKQWLGRLPPGEHLSIYSNTEKTNDSIIYDYRFTNGFRDPTDSGQGGDGTVPTTSANVGKYVLFNAGSHVAIPNRQDAYDKIAIYLQLGKGR